MDSIYIPSQATLFRDAGLHGNAIIKSKEAITMKIRIIISSKGRRRVSSEKGRQGLSHAIFYISGFYMHTDLIIIC